MRGHGSITAPIDAENTCGSNRQQIAAVQKWFEKHVQLDGKPYFLDYDQARAVTDLHHNTLVTARAGSGKTRVIVAKVAYLISQLHYQADEIAVFMFNRTAAAEVNERIVAVLVDGEPIIPSHSAPLTLATTFHKFALDILKANHFHPQIISETDENALICQLFRETVGPSKLAPQLYQDLLKLTHNFIARAGQKFPGRHGLAALTQATEFYLAQHRADPAQRFACMAHQLALAVYTKYLAALESPRLNFNLLMAQAASILQAAQLQPRVDRLKYLMIDEYQDFSDLFYNLVQAIRGHCPTARLFAVGDDWQAINRFAGSDVNYFLHFPDYFSDDAVNIPLSTNYRSARRIVENANRYMLTNYDAGALPAVAFQRKTGKIYHLNPVKVRFDARDQLEDGLGDGFYQSTLAAAMNLADAQSVPLAAAQLLKLLTKLCTRHRHQSIMLLHRHNFTSFKGLTLTELAAALRLSLTRQNILSAAEFDQQIRFLTMHRSKGLESEVVVILEADAEIIAAAHPHATIFKLFGDTRAAEIADQQRLLYVAMTRAKEKLYILSTDPKPRL